MLFLSNLITLNVFTKVVKRALFMLKHVDSLYDVVVVVLHAIHIFHTFYVAFKHVSICDGWHVLVTNHSLVDQKHPDLNRSYDGSCLNEKVHLCILNSKAKKVNSYTIVVMF
jgi:hypothetical protein